ncbi:winged helix-turn-helix transcriptional regulator [Nocardia sp. NEAU-351]|uniref:Winged helix-turn-helix transcriptional regulator n=1 Tax=Nocardia bovistercoris TaxID=2785916 RepID=A0A931ICG6_9NOCA|nr:winged helix-turn-helix transcriptional regulator [Nocardia bovistercoris]
MSEDVAPNLSLPDSSTFLLGQLGYLTQGGFTERLAPVGIRPRHFGMLRLLRENDGQSQQRMAETLGIHRNVMVGLVDDLEKRGLVERRRHPSDRRAHAVYLLPAAHAVLARAQAVMEDFEEDFLTVLDASERAELRGLLQRVAFANGLRPGVHPGFASDRLDPSC